LSFLEVDPIFHALSDGTRAKGSAPDAELDFAAICFIQALAEKI